MESTYLNSIRLPFLNNRLGTHNDVEDVRGAVVLFRVCGLTVQLLVTRRRAGAGRGDGDGLRAGSDG